MGTFDSIAELLQQYTNWAFRTGTEFSQDHAGEFRERLDQLSFLCARIAECEEQQSALGYEDPGGQLSNFLTLKLYVEAFYYFACRVRQILKSGTLPGLKSFESAGVRNVRNHLIEHPEGKDGVTQLSFGFSPSLGMQLKPGRKVLGDGRFVDPGFHANLTEFRRNLEAALSRVVGTETTAD